MYVQSGEPPKVDCQDAGERLASEPDSYHLPHTHMSTTCTKIGKIRQDVGCWNSWHPTAKPSGPEGLPSYSAPRKSQLDTEEVTGKSQMPCRTLECVQNAYQVMCKRSFTSMPMLRIWPAPKLWHLQQSGSESNLLTSPRSASKDSGAGGAMGLELLRSVFHIHINDADWQSLQLYES